MKRALVCTIGSLVGGAIGDALGMPVEIMSAEKISQLTAGYGIQTFLDPFPDGAPWLQQLKAGDTTDDTQLAMALTRSLIHRGNYDQHDCACEFAKELDRSVCGWGGTTKRSVQELKQYFETNGASGRSPDLPARVDVDFGTGNGVAMRIAPLGLFYGLQLSHSSSSLDNHLQLRRDVLKNGFLTHGDSRAVVAGLAVAVAIANLVGPKRQDIVTLADKRQFLELVLQEVTEAETGFALVADSFSQRLSRLLQPGLLDDPLRLRQEVGTSCFALESVVFAFGMFLRNQSDFRTGLLETINAGGDTDTNAAIVGNLIGAYAGIEVIPQEWRNYSAKFAEIADLANALYNVSAR